ncbi:MAG: hypothetical protein DRN29_00765 [Thermoplasmata archaeon]|nr:MAG: hypothetical protein DRN29_00765 [Thermoplasmata archaeon]
MEELRKLIAFVFQRSGKEKMTEKEFYMTLSFELGWLTPGEGMKVIEKAMGLNLLKKDGDEIFPSFNYKDEEVPLGFKFDNKKLEELEKDLLSKIVGKISHESKIGEKKIRDEIRKISEDLDIYPEIAALLLAKKVGIEVDEFIDDAKEFIKNN